jgi:hypothetical protein
VKEHIFAQSKMVKTEKWAICSNAHGCTPVTAAVQASGYQATASASMRYRVTSAHAVTEVARSQGKHHLLHGRYEWPSTLRQECEVVICRLSCSHSLTHAVLV